MTVQGPADRSGGAGLGPEAPLIWSEDALRPWLSQELAWTFPGASGFCKRSKRSQRPCLPPPTQLCQTQHAPTGSAHRAVVKTRLFSQPGGRVWRQGREVRWQRMPRYLWPQEFRRQLPGGRVLRWPLETFTWLGPRSARCRDGRSVHTPVLWSSGGLASCTAVVRSWAAGSGASFAVSLGG